MLNGNPFVISGWKINDWKPDPTGLLPKNAFKIGGTLSIGGTGPEEVCDLDWHDQDGLPCFIRGLPFDARNAKLTALAIPVSFAGQERTCAVTLFISAPLELKGTFTIPGDGNAGTFAADAHQPPRTTGPE